MNARLASEGLLLRRDGDKTSTDNYELRKENEFSAARNLDMAAQVRELEARLKDRDDQLFLQRKDLDQAKITNGALRG